MQLGHASPPIPIRSTLHTLKHHLYKALRTRTRIIAPPVNNAKIVYGTM